MMLQHNFEWTVQCNIITFLYPIKMRTRFVLNSFADDWSRCFLQGRCLSCHPTNSFKSPKRS